MITAKRKINVSRRQPMLTLLCTAAFTACALFAAETATARAPDELRVMTAFNKFDDTTLIGVSYHTGGFGFLLAHHVDWSLGVLARRGDYRPFVSVGPAWRLGDATPWFADFSVSPTLLADPRLDGKTLGSNIQFTLAASLGRRLGDNWAISIRAQHISNSGIHDRNPGLDSIGLSISNLSAR